MLDAASSMVGDIPSLLLLPCRRPLLQLLGMCHAHGLLLLATELMKGGSLHARLGSPELRYGARGREILRQVAAALDYLHTRGIVHMDGARCWGCLLGLLIDTWGQREEVGGCPRRSKSSAPRAEQPAAPASPPPLLPCLARSQVAQRAAG